MSSTIRQATQYGLNTAVTSISLLTVLAMWPFLSLIRALRHSH